MNGLMGITNNAWPFMVNTILLRKVKQILAFLGRFLHNLY